MTNFVSCVPQITAQSPGSRNAADILNAGVVQFAVGNCKGIRIPGTPDNTHRNTRFSFYGGDNWRLRSNLSLNLGLRYEVDTHPLNNDLPKPDLVAPLLPRGTAPTPIDKNGPGLRFNDSYISQDLQVGKTFRVKERMQVEGKAQPLQHFKPRRLRGPAVQPVQRDIDHDHHRSRLRRQRPRRLPVRPGRRTADRRGRPRLRRREPSLGLRQPLRRAALHPHRHRPAARLPVRPARQF